MSPSAHSSEQVPPAAAGSTGAEGTLAERYAEVKRRIAGACERAGREPSTVLLVAVTKYAEPDQIRELVRLGHVDLGENRSQQLIQRAAMMDEWLQRHRDLPGAAQARLESDTIMEARSADAPGPPPRVRWHMVGHLQRNKVRKVVEFCRLIHSVDSLRLAEEVQQVAVKRDSPIDILLQVNTSGEKSKFGCAVPAAIHLAEQIDTMLNVRLRGVMVMAPLTDDQAAVRTTFRRAREVFLEIRDAGVSNGSFNILSMGMSSDFELAIEEGANLVRVGSAIFGEPAHRDADEDDDE